MLGHTSICLSVVCERVSDTKVSTENDLCDKEAFVLFKSWHCEKKATVLLGNENWPEQAGDG